MSDLIPVALKHENICFSLMVGQFNRCPNPIANGDSLYHIPDKKALQFKGMPRILTHYMNAYFPNFILRTRKKMPGSQAWSEPPKCGYARGSPGKYAQRKDEKPPRFGIHSPGNEPAGLLRLAEATPDDGKEGSGAHGIDRIHSRCAQGRYHSGKDSDNNG